MRSALCCLNFSFLGVLFFLVLEASFRTSTPSDSAHSKQFLRKSTDVFKEISLFLSYITYNFMMVSESL